MAVSRKRSIGDSFIHNQLHIPHATAEVGVEVSCNGRVRDFILLVGRLFNIGDMKGVSENAVRGEKAVYKGVPVTEIVLGLGALSASCQRGCQKHLWSS